MSRRASLLVAAFLVLGKFASAEILLHPDLTEGQRRSIQFDLATLDHLAPKDDRDTAEAALKMGITGKVDARILREWLETRLRYVVPQSWDFQTRATTVSNFGSYPNPGIFPVIEKSTKKAANGPGEAKAGEVTIVMMNLGASLYFSGKKLSKLITLEIDPLHREPLLSPRLGLVKIGKGLFSERFRGDLETADTDGNALLRLATFFHESRHSDGNGTSLGFLHAVCPQEESYGPYAGMHACDRNRNGPYTVGKSMMKVMLKQCESCSDSAKEAIRAKILDSASRVIRTTNVPSTERSTTFLRMNVSLCDFALAMGRMQTPECGAMRRRLATALLGTVVDTVDLDAEPEMIER